ncbi:MAG: sulfite exporter TauE/SafE family protein [Fusobacteriaceae bacterium]
MLKDTLFLIVIFSTNIIQGITGFAGTVLAMPPIILLQGIDIAKPILNLLGLLASVWMVFRDLKKVNIKELFKIISFMLIGMILGIYAYDLIPTHILIKFYAAFIIAIALKGIFIKNETETREWIMVLIIFLSGIIHGLFISGGPLLMIYALKKLKDKSEFRATISGVWIFLNTYLAFSHYRSGLFTSETINKFLWSIIPLFFGLVIGNKLHHKMKANTFLILTYILLIISGAILLF